MNLTGIVCKFESECLRNSSSMLQLWQVGLPNLSDILWPQWSLALVIFPSSKASARRQLRGCTSKRMLQKIWMDLFLLTTYSDQWLQLFRKHQRNKWWPSALRRRIFFYARSSALGCLTRLEARSASEDVKPPKPTGGHKLHKPCWSQRLDNFWIRSDLNEPKPSSLKHLDIISQQLRVRCSFCS